MGNRVIISEIPITGMGKLVRYIEDGVQKEEIILNSLNDMMDTSEEYDNGFEKMKKNSFATKYLMDTYGKAEKDIKRVRSECTEAKYNWELFDTLAGYMESQNFIFAKKLKDNPHFYTLRKLWKDDQHFIDTVIYMRMVGYTEYWWGGKYNMWNINDWKYWTMGASINKDGQPYTILINRKHIDLKGTCHYDYIAKEYDSYFENDMAEQQNGYVMNYIDYKKGEKILDIGCGTGLFLDYCTDIDIDDYLGIDCSSNMLEELYKKHGFVNAIKTKFEDFYYPQKFDKIIALFGTFSYINSVYLGKVVHYLNPGGRAIIMFYGSGYHPVAYEKSGVEVPFKEINKKFANGWDIKKYGNYLIAEFTK